MSRSSLCEVRVRGGLLPVWTQAGGPAALVFLHDWGGSRRTFAPVIASLSSRCTVVVYDQRGWGAARDLPGPYGINQLADDVVVANWVDRYVLVGHSMGGKVAQLAALRDLEGLAGVVLIAPAPPRPTVDADAAQRRSHAYDSRESISDALQVRSGSNYSANTEWRTRHIANARIGARCAKSPHHPCAHRRSSEGVR